MSLPSTKPYVVVIGASAGGLEAVSALLGGLEGGFPAAVLFVMHLGSSSHLAHILGKRTALPVAVAVNGTAIEPGRVYVGVPDRHLLVHDSHILLRRGPYENLARPAIDPLFRTAALSFGGRAIGVVLSGSLSDGSAGLRAIKTCGGIAVVQDPREAAFPSMPRNALRHAEVDHVAPAGAIGGLLARLVRQPPGPSPEVPLPIRLEAALSVQETSDMKTTSELGKPSPFTCPECHGALWEIQDGPLVRYRCHIGHAFTADAVLAGHSADAQTLLESLLRSNRERAALTRRMADNERRDQHHGLADRFERRSREYDESARLIEDLIAAGEAEPVTNGEARGKVPVNGEEESDA